MNNYSEAELLEMANALGFPTIEEMQDHQEWLDEQASLREILRTSKLKPKSIQPVTEYSIADRFENAIREFGVGNACEWFGHSYDGEFAQDVYTTLLQRTEDQ